MSIEQKLLVFFFLFWTSFFIEGVLLKAIFVVLSTIYFNKDIPIVLFVFLFGCILFSENKTLVHVETLDEYCGKVVQVKEGYALLKNNDTQIAIFSNHALSYFDETCVSGTYKRHEPSSNFFNNPIETWISTNNHLGSLNNVTLLSHTPSNSIKGKLYDKAKLYPNNQILMGMLFDHSFLNNSLFAGLLLSSGLQYTYAIQIFRKITAKFLYRQPIAIITVILWIMFGLLWGFTFVWWRVFLCNVCVFFFRKRLFVLPLAYTLLLLMFSNMANHIAFVFPMFFQLILFSKKYPYYQRFSIIMVIQHVYLYSSNLLLIVFFYGFRHVSGLLFIFSWIALFFSNLYPLYQKISYFIISIPTFQETLFYGRIFPIIAGIIIMLLLSKKPCKKPKIIGYAMLTMNLLIVMYPMYDLVLFINVGQADATIVKKAFNNGSLLIDTARESDHVVLSQTIKGLGLKNLDAILISHDDNDHSGGLERIEQLLPNAPVYQQKNDIHAKRIFFQSLNKEYVGVNENDNSVIGILDVGGLRYLFLGDLLKQGEVHLVDEYPNLKVDVIKLAHHGSKTSTSPELISVIQPTFAIISAQKSVYGHPHDSTLKTLHNYQVIPLDTNTYGDIAFISLFDWQFVLTSSGLFGIIK